MEQYTNTELRKAIKSFQVKTAISKDGNPYTYLSLSLINGYEKRLFIQSAEEFAFSNAFELLSAEKVVEAEF